MSWLRSCALLFVIACTPAAAPAPTTTTPTPPPTTTPEPAPTPAPTPAPAGAVCGTRGAAACPAPEFCSYAPGDQCGATDKPGHCATRPAACPRIFAPVCGCDHKTYPNSCDAAAASVGVSATGACS